LDFDNAYHSYRLFRWFGAFSKKERMTSVSEELIDGECQAIPTEEETALEEEPEEEIIPEEEPEEEEPEEEEPEDEDQEGNNP
jgi:hypothetical protein